MVFLPSPKLDGHRYGARGQAIQGPHARPPGSCLPRSSFSLVAARADACYLKTRFSRLRSTCSHAILGMVLTLLTPPFHQSRRSKVSTCCNALLTSSHRLEMRTRSSHTTQLRRSGSEQNYRIHRRPSSTHWFLNTSSSSKTSVPSASTISIASSSIALGGRENLEWGSGKHISNVRSDPTRTPVRSRHIGPVNSTPFKIPP